MYFKIGLIYVGVIHQTKHSCCAKIRTVSEVGIWTAVVAVATCIWPDMYYLELLEDSSENFLFLEKDMLWLLIRAVSNRQL